MSTVVVGHASSRCSSLCGPKNLRTERLRSHVRSRSDGKHLNGFLIGDIELECDDAGLNAIWCRNVGWDRPNIGAVRRSVPKPESERPITEDLQPRYGRL